MIMASLHAPLERVLLAGLILVLIRFNCCEKKFFQEKVEKSKEN